MLKLIIVMTFVLLLGQFLLMPFVYAATGNLFWVTSTQGTPTSFLGGPASQMLPNVDPLIFNDGTDWVVFSTGGKLKLTGSSKIKGLTGTNATGMIDGSKPVVFEVDTVIDTQSLLYIGGPGSVQANIISYPTWWEWGNAYQKELRLLIMSDKVKKLPNPLIFNVSDVMKTLNFGLLITEQNKVTRISSDISTTWNDTKVKYIVKNGVFNKIETILPVSMSQGLKVIVGNHDIVIRTNILSITNNGEIIISRKSPTSTGRVFFVVYNTLTLGGIGLNVIGENDDLVFILFLGTSPIVISGNTKIYGSIYLNSSNIKITASGKIKDIITLGELVEITGGSLSTGQIYGKAQSVKIAEGAKIAEGIYTGGSAVNILGGVQTFKYIYAPLAKVIINNNLNKTEAISGTVIGKEIELLADSWVFGPSHKPIPPNDPTIAVPIVYQEQYGYDLDWYDYESGQITYKDGVQLRSSESPVVIQAKESKNIKYPNKNVSSMTWQAPEMLFLSGLEPTHNNLTLNSDVITFQQDIDIKDDGIAKITLLPLTEMGFITFKNVRIGSTLLPISNKSFYFIEEIDIINSFDRGKLIEIKLP